MLFTCFVEELDDASLNAYMGLTLRADNWHSAFDKAWEMSGYGRLGPKALPGEEWEPLYVDQDRSSLLLEGPEGTGEYSRESNVDIRQPRFEGEDRYGGELELGNRLTFYVVKVEEGV